jgi:GDP-4-dehydro-6-deoxy-D-mannose reductase
MPIAGVVLVVALISWLSASLSMSSVGRRDDVPELTRPTKAYQPIPVDSIRIGERFRVFDNASLVFHNGPPAAPAALSPTGRICPQWAITVATDINVPGIQQLTVSDAWCVVIVAPGSAQVGPFNRDSIVVLGQESPFQASLHPIFKEIPANHTARKNLGYLYAIVHGATRIWDFDAEVSLMDTNAIDIIPRTVSMPALDKRSINVPVTGAAADKAGKFDAMCNVMFNPLGLLGAPVTPMWNRGFPVNCLSSGGFDGKLRIVNSSTVAVWQVLSQHEPDVDAAFRFAHRNIFPIEFTPLEIKTPVAIPQGMMYPYSDRSQLSLPPAFWALFLPSTVHSYTCDIVRSYIAQRIMWDFGMHVAFTVPQAMRSRSERFNLAIGVSEEKDLHEIAGIVHFLTQKWKPVGTTIPSRLENLMVALFERGYIELSDVVMTQQWLLALVSLGYEFPALSPKNLDSRLPLSITCVNQPRILITGISGMIGSHVAREIVKDPCNHVFGLVRPRSNLESLAGFANRVQLLTGDLKDSPRMYQILEEVRPDYIYHFAAQSEATDAVTLPGTTMQTNLLGTFHMFDALRRLKLKPRVLLPSSSSVYFTKPENATTSANVTAVLESAPTKPTSPYGVSKVSVEKLGLQYYRAFGIPVIVARLFPQLGIGGVHSSFLNRICERIAMAEKRLAPPTILYGRLDGTQDFLHVDDTANALVALMGRGSPGTIYNVGSGVPTSMEWILRTAMEQAKVSMTMRKDSALKNQFDNVNLVANTTLLSSIMSWDPRPIDDMTVHKVLKYWRQHVASLYLAFDGSLLDNKNIYHPNTLPAAPSPPPTSTSGYPKAALLTFLFGQTWVLHETLPTWHANLQWMGNYEFFVFFDPRTVPTSYLEQVAPLAPTWKITFIRQEVDLAWYQNPPLPSESDPFEEWTKIYSLYFSTPELAGFDYIMRLEPTVYVLQNATVDVFADMASSNVQIGWAQQKKANPIAWQGPLLADIQRYVQYHPKKFYVSDVWRRVNQANNTQLFGTEWSPFLSAGGLIELYSMKVYRNAQFLAFLQYLQATSKLLQRQYFEAEVKTMWAQIFVPAEKWKLYACALPVYTDASASTPSSPDLLSSSCDFESNLLVSREGVACISDPGLRFC